MRLLFHVGLPKTGSTRIQNVGTRARNELEVSGVYWPLSCALAPGEGDTFGHHRLALALQARQFEVVRSLVHQAYLDACERDLDCILFSSEGFATCRPEDYQQVFSAAPFSDIEIVCYLRPYPVTMLSWYAQDVHALTLIHDFAHWHMNLVSHYLISAFLAACVRYYPESVRIRYFDRNNFVDGDIWNDFVSNFLGGRVARIERGAEGDAVGLRGSLLLMKRNLNRVSIIERAMDAGADKIGAVMRGQVPEKGYLWHMFSQLARSDRFRLAGGYPLADCEKEYLYDFSVRETESLERLGVLPDSAVADLWEHVEEIQAVSCRESYRRLPGDVAWVLGWLRGLSRESSNPAEVIVANDAENAIRYLSVLPH